MALREILPANSRIRLSRTFSSGDDLLALAAGALFDQPVQIAQARAGLVQRRLEFQVAFAQVRQFLGHRALASRRRTKPDTTCWMQRKPTIPARMAIGQPTNSASAAPKVAQTKTR